MRITKSSISFEVNKALSQMQGNSFQMEDVSSLVQRTYAKPKLLTALLNPMANEEFEMTDTFKFDEVTGKASLPDGKSYQDHGSDIEKIRARELRYSIPSFGIKFNVAPQDYIGRRKAGSSELLTEADVVAQMAMAAEDSWTLFDELGMRELLVSDVNIIRGGPFEQYNFYTDIVGSGRAAALDMTLGTLTIDQVVAFRKQRKLIEQELGRAGDSATKVICVCGDTFFNSRYEVEKQEGLARELRSTVDLASQQIAQLSDGTFMYDNFEGNDGILYINYGSEIIAGTKLIADADAYLVPMGASKLIKVAYAPAQTRQYANTQALQSYAWSSVDDRQGVTVMQESNKLFANVNPRAIIHLTSSN